MIIVLSLSIPKMLQRASKRSRAALAHIVSKKSIYSRPCRRSSSIVAASRVPDGTLGAMRLSLQWPSKLRRRGRNKDDGDVPRCRQA